LPDAKLNHATGSHNTRILVFFGGLASYASGQRTTKASIWTERERRL